MPTNPLRVIVNSFRTRFDPSDDAQLLERFTRTNDPSAFAALVSRHGPLVWGVCLRVAGNHHSAEDAFQATWIVFSRKVRSLKAAGSLPGWLHRVAFRLALAARARPADVLTDVPVDSPGPPELAAEKEVREAIDEEIERLPRKYRLPVVLCVLQGRTLVEAAAELGWPLGTVAGRMARAKELLRTRLTRRGLAPSVGPLPVSVGAPPLAIGDAAGKATALASALLAGEAKRRWAVAALLLSCLAIVAGLGALRPWSAHTPAPPFRVDDVGAFALSPKGDQVAVWKDGAVRLVSVPTSVELKALDGGRMTAPAALRFSHDGKQLACAGAEVRIWDLSSGRGRLLSEGLETKRPFATVLFSPDGDVLLASRGGETATAGETWMWDLRRSGEARRFEGAFAAISPDGLRFATSDLSKAWLWEAPSGKQLREFPSLVFPAFHPNGRTVAMVGFDAVVRLYDIETGKEKATFDPHPAAGTTRPASLGNVAGTLVSEHRQIDMNDQWGAIMGAQNATSLGDYPWAMDLRPPSFGLDGKTLASSFGDETYLWDVPSGKLLARLKGSPRSFSPDGEMIATRTAVWAIASRQPSVDLLRFTGPKGETFSGADRVPLFGPGGDCFFAVWEGSLRRYDAGTGRER